MKHVNKVGIYSIKPHEINIKESVVTTVRKIQQQVQTQGQQWHTTFNMDKKDSFSPCCHVTCCMTLQPMRMEMMRQYTIPQTCI